MTASQIPNLPFPHAITTPAEDDRAVTAIRSLLAGTPELLPTTLSTYGDWCADVLVLGLAYAHDGVRGAEYAFTKILCHDPGLADLVAAPLPPPQDDLPDDEIPAPEIGDIPIPPPWILPGILPVGLSLLTGRPGAGAADLALQWAIAAARPAAVRPGSLYIGCAAPRAHLVRQLRLLHPAPDLPLELAHDWPSLAHAGMHQIIAAIQTHRLVVLEGLHAALADLPGDDPAPIVDILHRLHALATVTNSAILLVDDQPYPPLVGTGESTGVAAEPDPVAAALFTLDEAWRFANVLSLTRRDGSPHGLVTSIELSAPLAVHFPTPPAQPRRARATAAHRHPLRTAAPHEAAR